MDDQTAENSSPPRKLSVRERYFKYLTRLLIRGFLEAAESVDVDAETIEELLQGFDGDGESDEEDHGEDDEDEVPSVGELNMRQSEAPETEVHNPEFKEQTEQEEEEEEESEGALEEEFDAQFTQESKLSIRVRCND